MIDHLIYEKHASGTAPGTGDYDWFRLEGGFGYYNAVESISYGYACGSTSEFFLCACHSLLCEDEKNSYGGGMASLFTPPSGYVGQW